MDEVYHSIQQFERNLELFNDRLNSSFEDLNKNHENVNPHWQDSMRKDYDMRWLNLRDKMKQYVTIEGGSYVDILLNKENILKSYLHGN